MSLYMNILTILLIFLTDSVVVNGDEKEDCKKKMNELYVGKDDDTFLKFFDDCVVKFYGFEQENDEKWVKSPTFGDALNDEHFEDVAKAIEKFFKKESGQNDGHKRTWEQINKAMESKKKGIEGEKEKCKKMLRVIAARQLYVTYALKKAANSDTFSLCEETKEGKIIIPEFACYPENAGSKRCTSDYDVSLIGPQAWKMVPVYNKHFQDTFKMTSEALFDNNLYAFSLEFALPEIFQDPGDKENYATKYYKYLEKIKKKDKEVASYQTQNIALAYMKVFKFEQKEEEFYEKQVKECLSRQPYSSSLKTWLKNIAFIKKKDNKIFNEMDNKKKLDIYEFQLSLADKPWSKEYTARLQLAIAGVFASESYFSKGAIRVVVGSQQMGKDAVTKGLTLVDHWTSFIENFGDVLKEYRVSCIGKKNIYKCLLKLSKYLYRTFTSIHALLEKIPEQEKASCLKVENEEEAITRLTKVLKPSALEIINSWVKCFKDKGITEISREYDKEYCQEAKALDERKDWAEDFLTRVLDCKDKLNEGSSYDKPAVIPPQESNLKIGIVGTSIQPPREEQLDTEKCISKLKLLVRGVNRRMLQYTDVMGHNLGVPITEV